MLRVSIQTSIPASLPVDVPVVLVSGSLFDIGSCHEHMHHALTGWWVPRELAELVVGGLGMHHAGMLRSDRNLVERLFRDGVIKVRPVDLSVLPAAHICQFYILHPPALLQQTTIMMQ